MITGILLQWNFGFSVTLIAVCFSFFTIVFILLNFLPVAARFRLQSLQGSMALLLITSFAMFITWNKDVRHHQNWYGNSYNDSSYIIVRISEPIVEKLKSFKLITSAATVINNSISIPVTGKIFVYLSKDSIASNLHYGDKILIHKPLQPIKNSGNPGAFNYKRYAAFQLAFHTVYLKPGEWAKLKDADINKGYAFIFSLRTKITNILKKHIVGNNDIVGIAEALLIGYKEDLDKDLVQSYSNAGVVHIIAISGLHLGLIYVLLVWIFNRLPYVKNQRFLKVIFVLGILWLFSLLTGASASVLRSAVMFTCIVIGKSYFKQSSIYNSLAASAFILLCFDPFFLWDVGFQLSYLAVIGIVALQQPIAKLLYIKNKWLAQIWGMLSVTIAAQLFTFPICLFYFHQFPNLFFITNLLAVPLSTIILFAELFLISVSFIPLLCSITGIITGWLIWLMNTSIDFCNKIPFSLTDNIYATLYTSLALYAAIIFLIYWLQSRKKRYLNYAIFSLIIFTALHSYASLRLRDQKKIIIYNVPGHKAIDFINQNQYVFKGDSSMNKDLMLSNFHLKPARINLQASVKRQTLNNLYVHGNSWQFFDKKLMIIDSTVQFLPIKKRINPDVLLISGNPAIKIAHIVTAIDPAIIVFDASNSLWKIAAWKKECLALALPCFSIPEKGAYILDIE